MATDPNCIVGGRRMRKHTGAVTPDENVIRAKTEDGRLHDVTAESYGDGLRFPSSLADCVVLRSDVEETTDPYPEDETNAWQLTRIAVLKEQLDSEHAFNYDGPYHDDAHDELERLQQELGLEVTY